MAYNPTLPSIDVQQSPYLDLRKAKGKAAATALGQEYETSVGDQPAPEDNSTQPIVSTTVVQPASAPPAASGASAAAGASDPLGDFVDAQFKLKGLTPRDAQDRDYWKRRITETGGLEDPGNKSYWVSRMAQSQGGAGDYLEQPGQGRAVGNWMTANPTTFQGVDLGNLGALLNASPDQYTSILQAILRQAAASGALNNVPRFGG